MPVIIEHDRSAENIGSTGPNGHVRFITPPSTTRRVNKQTNIIFIYHILRGGGTHCIIIYVFLQCNSRMSRKTDTQKPKRRSVAGGGGYTRTFSPPRISLIRVLCADAVFFFAHVLRGLLITDRRRRRRHRADDGGGD